MKLKLLTVAYAGFWKGGGGRKFRKFENNKHQNENFSTQNQSGFPVQIRERPKKRSSLKFSSFFGPKLDEDQKKSLHSNLARFLAQTWVQAKSKRLRLPFVCSNLLPKVAYKGGHAAILHTILYVNYTILETQRGAMAQWPSLNTPLAINQIFTKLNYVYATN